MSRLNLDDKRYDALAERALNKSVSEGSLSVNIVAYTETLIKETVLECMRQLAIPVDIRSEITSNIVQAQWDHLARRFSIAEQDVE